MQKKMVIILFRVVKVLLLLMLGLQCASADSFIVYKNNAQLIKSGNYLVKYPPCSTFKIFISLMGYEENILLDENNPKFNFQDGYTDWLPIWKQVHTPKMWIKNSCVWYSRVVNEKLGADKFRHYLINSNYSNETNNLDDEQNLLNNSWLNRSILVSPIDQMKFINRLLSNTLPFNSKSINATKELMYIRELDNGYKLYGKTGNGTISNNPKLQFGWFIGFAIKGDDIISFVKLVEDALPSDTFASFRARDSVIEYLENL